MNQVLQQLRESSNASLKHAQDIYAPILVHLDSVNDLLHEQIIQSGEIMSERLISSGVASGKRVRPALLLLCGAATGDVKKTHVAAAAAVELVHAATLVHDDVLDEAEHRRHEPSMNARWDNTTTILSGDYLFSKAFEVATASGSIEVVRLIAESSCLVCEGEIAQNAASGNFEISEAEYLRFIELKTAELCKLSSGLGALLSECEQESVSAFENYGHNLGVAFQIIDDVLDLVGNKERVGKTLGTDLINRKATLPVIHSLRELDQPSRESLLAALNSSDVKVESILQTLESTNSIEYARQMARDHAQQAIGFANSLPDSATTGSLRKLADFVVQRTY